MSGLIPNQSISFEPNNYCGDSIAPTFCLPIQYGDFVQLWHDSPFRFGGSEANQLFDRQFTAAQSASHTASTQDETTGSNAWTNDDLSGDGILYALSDSKLYNLSGSASISTYTPYYIDIEITELCPGATLYLVGVVEEDDGSLTLTTIASYTATGVFEEIYTTGATAFDYIGMYVQGGDCDGVFNTVEYVVFTGYSGFNAETEMDLVVKNCEGTVELMEMEEAEGRFYGDFYPSGSGFGDGDTVRFCFDGEQPHENLFTDGGDGDFEIDGSLTGIFTQSALGAAQRSAAFAFDGRYAFKAQRTNGNGFIVLRNSTYMYFKGHTYYRAVCRVYLDETGASAADASMYIRPLFATSNTFNSFFYTVEDEVTYEPGVGNTQQWVEVSCTFYTNEVNEYFFGRIALFADGTDWGSVYPDAEIYVDWVRVYEYNEENACSQCVKYVEDATTCEYMLLRWYNDGEAFGFRKKSNVSYTNWLNQVRLYSDNAELQLYSPQYNTETETHEDSEGEVSILYAETRKRYTLALANLPKYMHEALQIAVLSDHFFINGEEYVVASPYNVEWARGALIGNATVVVEEKASALKNTFCQ